MQRGGVRRDQVALALACEFHTIAAPGTTTITATPSIEPVTGIPTTAQSILELLLSLGRNRYTYTTGGSGCRHWCEVVLHDFEVCGSIAPGATKVFMKRMQEGHRDEPGRYPWPRKEGTFY
jgi:hypothetical protein